MGDDDRVATPEELAAYLADKPVLNAVVGLVRREREIDAAVREGLKDTWGPVGWMNAAKHIGEVAKDGWPVEIVKRISVDAIRQAWREQHPQ